MRVTYNSISSQVLGNITDGLEGLAKLQERLASSKQINRPSDDPLGTSLVIRLAAMKGSVESYQEAASAGEQFLGATSSALKDVTEVLQQVREIAVEGASDTTSSTRPQLAEQVNRLLEDLVDLSQSRFAGRYLFGGIQGDSSPFNAVRDANGDITTVTANPDGIGRAVITEVADGVRVETSIPGDEVFQGGVDVFQTVIGLRTALLADDGTAAAASIDSLASAIAQLNSATGAVGVSVQRIQAVEERNNTDLTRIETLRGQTEDADIAELYLELQQKQNAFQASLAAGAKALQMSLLDFLS